MQILLLNKIGGPEKDLLRGLTLRRRFRQIGYSTDSVANSSDVTESSDIRSSPSSSSESLIGFLKFLMKSSFSKIFSCDHKWRNFLNSSRSVSRKSTTLDQEVKSTERCFFPHQAKKYHQLSSNGN